MPKTERVKRRRKRSTIGDRDKRIFVENRSVTAPDFGDVTVGVDFDPHPTAAEVWANVQTTTGRTIFDGVDTDRKVTHRVIMEKLPGITPQTWLRLEDGTRLDIVTSTNLDERDEFLELLCEATGSIDRAGANA